VLVLRLCICVFDKEPLSNNVPTAPAVALAGA
jgi:hypothetical protein